MKLWKIFILIFTAIFLLIAIQIKNPQIVGPFKGLFGDIVNPLVYYSDMATRFVKDIYRSYMDLIGLKNKYDKILVEKKVLHFENMLLKEKLSEYERLKKLLNYKEIYNLETVACNVIGRSIDGYMKYILIDRGSIDGIEVNDPVISYDGLVGKITEVYRKSAKVICILNVSSNTSVINFKTRTVGILHGDGLGSLSVEYYIKSDNVTVDDIFVTSGLGKIYPKGIPVGSVEKVEINPSGLFRRIWVKSFVDFYKLENVLIVKLAEK